MASQEILNLPYEGHKSHKVTILSCNMDIPRKYKVYFDLEIYLLATSDHRCRQGIQKNVNADMVKVSREVIHKGFCHQAEKMVSY